ncbi:ribosomal protein L22/L17 [Rhodocollybia butyracea]|uniref:Ribosomal protein L22/L17 n=1 Tax=Rhodocollybia butyracea TaxID=206335 RepID=A0A9P5Q0F4_9AGAR|nr:ribosomal protein L22/L17 [Rhodocollybia butyracea]
MQRGFVHVTRSVPALHLPTNTLVGPSRLAQVRVQTRNASNYNPLNWLREKFAAERRKKETKQELLAAKEEAREEGQLSLFEQSKTVAPVSMSPVATGDAVEKTKATTVAKKSVKATKGSKKHITSHKYSTTQFKISPRKLNLLGNQIAGKPIDYAILQMQFSEKRASKRIMNMLATAKDHAFRYKHLDLSKLVVAEAWVNKGKVVKRLEPRGRGHMGIRKRKFSKMHVVLKEGKTIEEKKEKQRTYKLNRIVSSSVVREDKPIRSPGAMWAW